MGAEEGAQSREGEVQGVDDVAGMWGGGWEGVEWLGYTGWWEFEGINSPHQQRWWFDEPVQSNGFWRRMFCSFMPDCGGVRPELWGLQDEEEELQRRVEESGSTRE